MRVWGVIKKNDIVDDSIFSLEKSGQKQYFYLRKNMVKKYAKYLKEGVIVNFIAANEKETHHELSCYPIEEFIKIKKKKKHNVEIFYDKYLIQNGIAAVLNRNTPLLFIDFEMNMQDFVPIPNFIQEIVEAGYVLTDSSGAVRLVGHHYIKPTKNKRLTQRSLKFLSFSKEVFDLQAISFKEFYKTLVNLNNQYRPTIFVWGKSDIVTLNKCVEINKLPKEEFNFIDLLQLHVNYYNFKTSPGLFSMWENYYGVKLEEQEHDSLEDAMITKDVFFKFKKKVNTR